MSLFAPHAHPSGADGYAVSVLLWFVMMGALQ